jgi:hypothetical protein
VTRRIHAKPPVDEEARQVARADGQRAARWVAAYIAGHGHGPKGAELRAAMGWAPRLEWHVLGRLERRGWIEFADGELRPGPAASGASR